MNLRFALRHPLCRIEAVLGRLRGVPYVPPQAAALHAAAQAAGADHYLDPISGRRVSTAGALRALGSCCGLGCRHCPYEEGAGRATQPVRPRWRW
jgi:hypothetical protein